jgi:hypothetical protein
MANKKGMSCFAEICRRRKSLSPIMDAAGLSSSG